MENTETRILPELQSNLMKHVLIFEAACVNCNPRYELCTNSSKCRRADTVAESAYVVVMSDRPSVRLQVKFRLPLDGWRQI
jgi:hypothetical protein